MKRRSAIEPNTAYRMMVWTYSIMDLFKEPGSQLDEFNIKKGQTLVDYGCGPGRYLKKASSLVGPKGKVYGADIHPLAIVYSNKRVAKIGLENVECLIIKENRSGIPTGCADRIYALDMFHHVGDASEIMKEMRRIAKKNCVLFIEDGHQSREDTLEKVRTSRSWKLAEQTKKWIILLPR